MLALLLLLPQAPVPAVTAGPGLAEEAKAVEAPIAHVTVYSDRARVRRRAKLTAPGLHAFRLPDLPGAVLIDTVRVSATGAKVVRLEASPIDRDRFSIDQVDALLEKLEAARDALVALDAQRAVEGAELAWLSRVTPDPAVPEAARVGKPAPPIAPASWKRSMDFVEERRAAARERLRALDTDREKQAAALDALEREAARVSGAAFSEWKVQPLVILDADTPQEIALELEYFVPGASWTPAYDLRFAADEGKLRLETAGVVRQTTGEDWQDVAISLSTAIPGQGVDLPELLTWTLGEKSDFIPFALAAREPPPMAPMAVPVAISTPAERERALARAAMSERVALLQQAMGSLAGLKQGGEAAAAQAKAEAKRSLENYRRVAEESRARKTAEMRAQMDRPAAERPPPPPPPAPPPSFAPSQQAPVGVPSPLGLAMRTYDFAEDTIEGDLVKPDAASEVAVTSRSAGRANTTPTSLMRLGLFEPATREPPPQLSDPNLPALLAGGLDYVYDAAAKASIPSTGESLRVPLASDTYPVQTFYEAAPALSTTAYLKAKVKNEGSRPILAGPTNVFVGNDFAGQGRLETTGPGGAIELPLGADEDLRIVRKVVPFTETTGFFGKSDVTTYKTTVEIGNYKRRAVKVSVIEQVPKASREKVEVTLLSTNPKPDAKPDEDGIMRFTIEIPAGKTRLVELTYRIQRPADWKLFQE